MMKAMDAPSREECTAERPRSNTPNAALVLLNDPTFVEAARSLAKRSISEAGPSPNERIEFLFLETLSRPPSENESRLLLNLQQSTLAEYQSKPDEAARLLEVGLRKDTEGIPPIELATWTAVARAILNLSETNTRN